MLSLLSIEKQSFDRYGDELVVRAGDYGIDFVEQDGKYYLPLQTLNDFILWPARGQGLFFNGQALIKAAQITEGDLPCDLVGIRMNVDDFDEAYSVLLKHGFRNIYGEETVHTSSSKAAMMVSPSGFRICIIQHVKE